ncbi:MAG: sigma-70 family RNA polymerase sigma factor [Deferribacteraceae bacterium]|jgi:RNA polymerase sigma-70 factor (ECF subfamily)|nr:sigma-70 family RNA polymerase sigma factor [Deferribacteraceae bacterium]
MQDDQIINSVLNGNLKDFELLVLKYQKQLHCTANAITKNRTAAEDIVQDAFVKAYEKLDTLNNPAGFYPWIKKIVLNMSLNQYDRNKWNVDVSDGETDFFDSIAVYDTPEEKTLKNELIQYIKMFVDALPEKLRLVLVMREAEDLSYEEISEMLKVPVGTVRSRLFNARQLMRDQLIKQGLVDDIYKEHVT